MAERESDAPSLMRPLLKGVQSTYVEELQAIRGLAALLVVVHHCTFYYEFGKYRIWSEVLLNAHAAVILFFVLSGFVLAQTLASRKISLSNILHFYIKRAFRIYPALWVACCFGLMYVLLLHEVPLAPITSGWLNRSLRTAPIDFLKVFESFLGVENALPVSIWTVYIELLGSALLPFLLLLASHRRLAFVAASGLLLALSVGYGERMYLDSGVYLIDFAFGASIVVFKDCVPEFPRSKNSVIGFAVVSLFVLAFGRKLGPWSYSEDYNAPYAALIEATAATILIATLAMNALSGYFSRLRSKWLMRLGDISYGMYLLHVPVFTMVAGICGDLLKIKVFNTDPFVSTIILTAATLVITITLAQLTYKFVELPGIRLGKAVLARLRRGNSDVHGGLVMDGASQRT